MTQSTQELLEQGIEQGVFPNASCLLAMAGKTLESADAGNNPDSACFYDLASLTKPLCTAAIAMRLVQSNKLSLDQKVSDFFETTNLKQTSIKELLNHTSPLIDWSPFYEDFNDSTKDPKEHQQKILQQILNNDHLLRQEHTPLYSDLGYILLGAIYEKITGQDLNQIFIEQVTKPLGLEQNLFFVPLNKTNTKKTQDFFPSQKCSVRKKILQGQVMDRNAYVLGGVAGHAGLFGTSKSVHRVLQEWRVALNEQSDWVSSKIAKEFLIPDAKRAADKAYFTCGFDTPTKGISQSGNLISLNSIGHLGYSGTSFWWDLENDFWVILLSNRCFPTYKNKRISKWRPAFMNQIVAQKIHPLLNETKCAL